MKDRDHLFNSLKNLKDEQFRSLTYRLLGYLEVIESNGNNEATEILNYIDKVQKEMKNK